MNSFSGYTNLPATVIAAPVPGTCLPGNQDLLLAVFEKFIAGCIHFLSWLRYGFMITGLRGKPVALKDLKPKQIVPKHGCYDCRADRMNRTNLHQQNLNYPDAYAMARKGIDSQHPENSGGR